LTKQRLVPISKLMSLVLRHDPTTFGLTLDAEGFTSLEELLAALRTRLPDTSAADIVAVVETIEPDKRRFSIVDDEIRANYGHSLAERVAQQRAEPPALLLHGTTEAAVPKILAEGLSPMRRQYVHMTVSPALAAKVGSRHGKPLLLEVDARAAHEAGIAFYRANENFWLADAVPARFVRRKP
jgi:putative RNA 2'-phosphotransferase